MVKDREIVGFPMNGRKMENLRYPENGKMMGQRGIKDRGSESERRRSKV